MRSGVLGLVAIVAMSSAISCREPLPPADPEFVRDWQRWHDQRIGRLKSDYGWLSLVGLHWLQPGENRFDGVPGRYRLEAGVVTLLATEADAIALDGQLVTERELAADVSGKPDELTHGTLQWSVIQRGEKVGLRVRDAASPVRTSFTGIDCFPAHPRWAIEARWEAYPEPRQVAIPNVLGQFDQAKAFGRAHFSIEGKEYTLEPTADAADESLSFVFKDATAGHETYGAGRFLVSDPPQGGRVILDFNRAYNPPCVFTPYATCPLPRPENILPIRIEAGEKNWGKGTHG